MSDKTKGGIIVGMALAYTVTSFAVLLILYR
jgi:hypothetical protein